MVVRAKFHCREVIKTADATPQFLYEARFFAVHDSDTPENASFFAATPCGELRLQTLKADYFEPGKDYYLDLTPVD